MTQKPGKQLFTHHVPSQLILKDLYNSLYSETQWSAWVWGTLLDRFFPGAHVRAAEMSLQVILVFERVFNNQNQSCFLIIC